MKYQRKHSQHFSWNSLIRIVLVTMRRKKIFKRTHEHTLTYLYTFTPNFVLIFCFVLFCFVFFLLLWFTFNFQKQHTTNKQTSEEKKANWRITPGAFCFDLIFDCILSSTHSLAHSITYWVRFFSFFFFCVFNQIKCGPKERVKFLFPLLLLCICLLDFFCAYFFPSRNLTHENFEKTENVYTIK